jgi:hypothetical protein
MKLACGLVLPVRVFALLGAVSFCHGAQIEADAEFLADNMALARPSYDLAVSAIPAAGGELSARAGLSHWRMNVPANGMAVFSTDMAIVETGYLSSFPSFVTGLRLQGGMAGLAATPHYSLSGEVPLTITPAAFPGIRILSKAGMRCGYADDNPFLAAIGAKKLSASLKAGIGAGMWEFHAGYQYGHYDRIEREMYQPLLEDPVFFSVLYDTLNPVLNLIDVNTAPFPANDENRFALYFFGPVLPFLYAGASFTYWTMSQNNYLPIADADDARIFFTYFPYRTPQSEGSCNVILAVNHTSDMVAALCNKAEVKVNFPVFSFGSYRGYYQAVPGNILAGFKDFYYDYYGTGVLSVDAEYKKLFSHNVSLGLQYSWVSQPYRAYQFFGDGYSTYQYHTLRLVVGKGF